MRMKVLEAMARGKAVVTTPLGAEGLDCIDPEPPLAVAATAEETAAAIAGLLEDEDGRRRIGGAARKFAEAHHSPVAWGKRLQTVYAEAALRA